MTMRELDILRRQVQAELDARRNEAQRRFLERVRTRRMEMVHISEDERRTIHSAGGKLSMRQGTCASCGSVFEHPARRGRPPQKCKACK